MIKIYSLLFGIIASVSISLYVFMYILRDAYYYFKNKSLRKFINKILPPFSRYNSLLLVSSLVTSLLHVFGVFAKASLLNTGYIALFILIFIIKLTFFNSNKSNDSYKLKFLSYLLLFALIIHLFI